LIWPVVSTSMAELMAVNRSMRPSASSPWVSVTGRKRTAGFPSSQL
jgi:hypothetical protein